MPKFEPKGNRSLGVSTVENLLDFIGEIQNNSLREGLKETPERVSKAWLEWTSGYDQNPADVLKVFEDGAEDYDEMITERNLPFYSHCEHHMASFFGTVTISYIPNEKIVGLSKLSRLIDIYSKRLQVQERMTTQIANALYDHLVPLGVGVVVKARHLCMESRGISKQGAETVTSALRGVYKNDAIVRQEFLNLANGK